MGKGWVNLALKLLNDNKSYAWISCDRPSYAFLHGWGRDSSDFEFFYKKIDGMFIDLPGFGKSPEPKKVWSPNDYSIWLKEILPDSVDTLVAHSFGGRVAVHYLNNFPGLKSLILVGVPLVKRIDSPSGVKLSMKLLKKANRLGLVSDLLLETYKKKNGSFDYRNSEGLMRDILVTAVNDDMSKQLKNLDIPIKLIWGERDKEVPLRVAQEALGTIPDSRLFVLKDVGHNPFIENSNEVYEIIRDI